MELDNLEITGKKVFFPTTGLYVPGASSISFNFLDEKGNYLFYYNYCIEQIVRSYGAAVYPKYQSFPDIGALEDNKFVPNDYRLVVSNSRIRENAALALKVINSLEKELSFPLSKVYGAGEIDREVIFVGSKKWLRAPLLFTLFPLIVRETLYLRSHEKPNIQTWRDLVGGTDTEDAWVYNTIKTVIRLGIPFFFYRDPHLNFARKKLSEARPQIALKDSGVRALRRATMDGPSGVTCKTGWRKNFPKKVDWDKLAAELGSYEVKVSEKEVQ
jgi:hypothetical protein